jgi:hypothetical protein
MNISSKYSRMKMTGGSSHSGSTNVKKLKSIVKPNL